MGEIILRTRIKREPGMLYYCASDENGFLTIGQAPLARGGGRRLSPVRDKTKRRKFERKLKQYYELKKWLIANKPQPLPESDNNLKNKGGEKWEK